MFSEIVLYGNDINYFFRYGNDSEKSSDEVPSPSLILKLTMISFAASNNPVFETKLEDIAEFNCSLSSVFSAVNFNMSSDVDGTVSEDVFGI
jgi:hypothetical protein